MNCWGSFAALCAEKPDFSDGNAEDLLFNRTEQPMRKTLLVTEIFPPVHGGSGRWFWEIHRRYPPGSVEVLTDDSANGTAGTDASFPHPVHRFPMKFYPWGIASPAGIRQYYRIWKKLDGIVRDNGIEQVHCGRVIPEGLPALINRLRRGIPYTCYVHGEDVEVARTSREITILTRWVMRYAERIVANSENTADILRKWWRIGEDRLIVMTPGVDIQRFTPAYRDNGNRWPGHKVVLTVGRLQRRKGQDMMIRALPQVRQAVPDILYCIVGGGADDGYLRELADAHGVTDQVEFTGELTDDEMLACYQGCDLFALPNRRINNDDEGFGMVLLEAQSCGKPVLAGDAGGTRETLLANETGVIVDCTNPDTLAHAVVALFQDMEKLNEMGNAGREHVVNSFSWERLARKAQEYLA